MVENHHLITDLFKYRPFVMRGIDKRRVVSFEEDMVVQYISYRLSYGVVHELFPLIYSWTKNHRKRLKKIRYMFPDIQMEFYISIFFKTRGCELVFPAELIHLMADCRIDFGLDCYYSGYYDPSGRSSEVYAENKINFPPIPDANKSEWDNSVDITLNRLKVLGCDQELIHSFEKYGFKYYKDNFRNEIVVYDKSNPVLENLDTQGEFVVALDEILSDRYSNFPLENLEFEIGFCIKVIVAKLSMIIIFSCFPGFVLGLDCVLHVSNAVH